MAALTEEAVRERVNLRHQNLADVRSLSLPGTYHEKITHLGNSLKNFTRLKSLDLSRNALVSLEGIQHLIFLEKLNLYYNHISSLSEIFRLHSLTVLKDVDLRLNPVVKNESDYRLFVVHMLPNLRRLDDRPVRDSERKASLLHFTTDHAFELKDSSPTAKVNEIERSGQPRIAYINSMSRKCSVMDEEDEAVLNLITKCEWDLSKPLGITGSAKKDPEVEFHSLQSIRNIEDNVGITMNRKSETRPKSLQMWKQQANMPMDVSSENRNALKVQETDKEYRSLPDCSPTLPVVHNTIKQGNEKRKNSTKVTFSDNKTQDLLKKDPNLKFQDEAESYKKITTHANFTPHPDSQEISSPVLSSPKIHSQAQKIFNTLSASRLLCNRISHNGGNQPVQNQTYSAALQKNNRQPNVSGNVSKQETMQECGRNHPPSIQGPGPEEQRPNRKTTDVREVFETHQVATQSANKHLYEATPMEHLLDLVDKYWNGYKSLHCNEKFLSQAGPVLSAMQKSAPVDQQKDSATMCQEVNNLLLEKKTLQSHLSEQDQQYSIKINSLMSELSNTQKDMDILKQRLDQLLEENTNLKAHLLNVEQNVKNADSSSSLHLQLIDLQKENQQLRSENISLKQHLQHYDQIQELTEMLQESHRTLVSTNEHLLQELAETRTRHRTEVEQLHWNYNQLKKTMDKHPHSNMDNSRC
ncbi:centrosomal protein of 72 kDa isoform X1 [Dermochelys coriacea]|uniref:centrosomal protein of 72 kDa isoform X1 n=2 Tax=Dermochelys coriacea TaxID=27794 RepID=UPI0018E83703|nr:centrosomal protein of 72 kDa isoform X1 [Dermochelys coriacea]XP_043364492.1 centrosomal protein of 72 kDa isoform X1 [Dermochelys coriacea]XP_043364493.1 centrosomal protein of 72 kDa isoform X1 [Dermochelys coriacea]XP_043364494.1 centrosomal protein of 72 kDa isoform X1 [Dermochelys coriacea]XP_043364495.1 centrosomal protein of 72 kDa isoform X1 [Dermochelys coriacea]XP_043364496.1 centrosomal protein of 72 kDa isoform X1 [Dermochelys coriacea]XP_043364497.1 centrosomal protein of 72 